MHKNPPTPSISFLVRKKNCLPERADIPLAASSVNRRTYINT